MLAEKVAAIRQAAYAAWPPLARTFANPGGQTSMCTWPARLCSPAKASRESNASAPSRRPAEELLGHDQIILSSPSST